MWTDIDTEALMKKLVVIDGQGGRLGKLLVEAVKNEGLDFEITAVGPTRWLPQQC